MPWLENLVHGEGVAHSVFLLSIVVVLGLALGSLRIRGIGLGVAGVLFSGLLLGHFGFKIDPEISHFAKEFGLILFVYTIGMQAGPGFLASLKERGLPLNLLAVGVVAMGGAMTVAMAKWGGIPLGAAVGVLAGATTNTPSLGAAQEALKSLTAITPDDLALPGLGYAVAYPFGILGIILSMLVLRVVFPKDPTTTAVSTKPRKLGSMNLVVQNPNLDGLRIDQIPGFARLGVVISRHRHENEVQLARHDATMHQGDVLLAIGPQEKLDQLRVIVGIESPEDLRQHSSPLVTRRLIVTQKSVSGKQLGELAFIEAENVVVTRITRGEVELGAVAELRLQFGDMLLVVGEEKAIERVAQAVGNSVKQLNHTEIIPIFVGITLGVLAGSIPLVIPGMPAPVLLGLAGGPLLVSLLLSHIGRIGPLLWYMPMNANFVLRELGIVLFLGCVGLQGGGKFIDTLVHGDGLLWTFCGAGITLVPLLIAGVIARTMLKLDHAHTCGLLAGSMTDPPALAFANSLTGSEAPSVAYATVYPLTMLLRVVSAQIIVLVFA